MATAKAAKQASRASTKKSLQKRARVPAYRQRAGYSHAQVALTAATALLKFSRESIELDDLATRVDDLEKSMKDEQTQREASGPAATWGAKQCV